MTLAALGWNEHHRAAFAVHSGQGVVPGRVIGEHRTHYQVATDAIELMATTTGRLRNAAAERTDLPGVGDFVVLRPSLSDGPSTIEAVLPRTSALVRKASGETRPQLIAANLDVVLIVVGLDSDFSLPRIERYLALVRGSGAVPVIVANKADLSDDVAARIAEIAAMAPGVALHALSARVASDSRVLEPYFDNDHTVGLIGSSGVGKSTLTNKLLGRDAQATQAVRAHDGRGRHTTTHRQIFLRPHGGSIMDTPGMRELEAWGAGKDTDSDFADIEALSLDCRFRNCQHGGEPGCAVRNAVQKQGLDAARVARYIERVRAARPSWR